MGGYTKNIAVIRGIKEGFSADGGALSGIVKVEKYGTLLRAELTKINFAPIAEGRFVTALSDGSRTIIFDGDIYEGESSVDAALGFSALICYVNGGVQPIAAAVCGKSGRKISELKAAVEQAENVQHVPEKAQKTGDVPPKQYEDEAIAEVNYYESCEADADGGVVCAAEEKEEDGREPQKDEAPSGTLEEAGRLKLAGGAFYEKMKDEVEGLLKNFPAEDELCRIIENSRWVKISYSDKKYYVFGVIYEQGLPRYFAYGVPAETSLKPPKSMDKLASYIPSESGGWWMTYQDAQTGAAIKLETQ